MKDDELSKVLGDVFDESNKPEDVAEETVVETAKDTTKEKTPEAPVVAAEAKEITDQSEVAPVVVAPVSQAPDHWSAGAKAHWEKLDPVVRAEALKQQDFVNKMQSRNAQERRKYESIDAVLEPQRNLLRANYGDEATGLKSLFALSDFASKDPNGFIQWFAQQRGIDLRGQQQMQPQRAIDPTINALQQRVDQLNQQVSGFTQSQEQAIRSDIDRSYQDFASNPANKYIDHVREDMALFLETGKAKDWQSAYNIAIKINPIVSEMVESEKIAEANEKRRKEAEVAVNKAQKAKSMNVASQGVAINATGKKGSWQDTLKDVGEKAFGA